MLMTQNKKKTIQVIYSDVTVAMLGVILTTLSV